MFTPADYNGVLQGLLGGTIDMAGLGASGYAKVWLSDPQAIIPAVTRINKGGGFGYHSIAFARRDSGINSLADMRARVFGFGDPRATDIYVDNKGAITMGLHPANKPATRHIDMRIHFCRQHVEQGDVSTSFMPTPDMVADFMTKQTARPTHVRHALRTFGNQAAPVPIAPIQHLVE